MTNEQTIDEIMGQADDYARAYAWRAEEKAALRNMITAALASKDAEISALKAQLAEPAKPEPGEWIKWKGGKCPIADDVLVTIKCRDGDVQHDHIPSNVDWDHSSITDYWGDIVAYRVMA